MAAPSESAIADDSSPRIKIRIESLSDLIFGLALSIGSLEFLSNPAQNATTLVINIAFFGFSFLILVSTWLGYSRTMAVIPQERAETLYLNLALLFLVAIEPYLFFVLVTAKADALANVSSTAYGLDVGSMFLIQAALSHIVITEDKESAKLGHKRLNVVIIRRFRGTRTAEIVIGLAYFLSVLPIFWQIETPVGPARFIFWWASFSILFVVRSRIRMKQETKGKSEQKVAS